MGQVRWKIFIHHTISATLPSIYQNLLQLVEIWRSADRNKNAVFWDMVYVPLYTPGQKKDRGICTPWRHRPWYVETNVSQGELPSRQAMAGRSPGFVSDHHQNCWTSSGRPPSVRRTQWVRAVTAGHTGRPIGCPYPDWKFTQTHALQK